MKRYLGLSDSNRYLQHGMRTYWSWRLKRVQNWSVGDFKCRRGPTVGDSCSIVIRVDSNNKSNIWLFCADQAHLGDVSRSWWVRVTSYIYISKALHASLVSHTIEVHHLSARVWNNNHRHQHGFSSQIDQRSSFYPTILPLWREPLGRSSCNKVSLKWCFNQWDWLLMERSEDKAKRSQLSPAIGAMTTLNQILRP